VTATGPRIPPLPVEEWTDDAKEAVRAAFGQDAADRMLNGGPDAPRVPNVLTTMMRHPALARRFLPYNAVLLNKPTISARHRELMILRVGWLTRAPYEFVQHVRMAAFCDITSEEVEAIPLGAEAEIWGPLERALLEATDQLIEHYKIDDDTWARLAEHLDERQLMEATFVVGTYTALAMVFNSLGIELDPDLDDVEAPRLPD
jgi:alkylhydroperoxidase family enzyme